VALPGSCDDFFDDPALVLHEHYHLVRQWPEGTLTYSKYLLQTLSSAPAGLAALYKTGSMSASIQTWHDSIPIEQQADAFAAMLQPAYENCLSTCGRCQ
jgi:hypothetical protein